MKGKYTNNTIYTLIKLKEKNKVKFFYIDLVYKTFTNYIINSFTWNKKRI